MGCRCPRRAADAPRPSMRRCSAKRPARLGRDARREHPRWRSTWCPQAGTRSRSSSASDLTNGRMATCNYAAAKSHEMRFATPGPGHGRFGGRGRRQGQEEGRRQGQEEGRRQGQEKDADKDKKDKEKEKEVKLPDEFLGQAIKEVVMHEVGHSLGLRHNFKASIMLKPEQINDTVDHPGQGDGRQRDGLQPYQRGPQGPEAGRLRVDYDRALRLLGDRVCLHDGDECRAEEARLPIARAGPGLRHRRRLHEQRSPGQHVRPDLRHPGLWQDADDHGRRVAQGPGQEGRQGRGILGAAPQRVLLLHQPVRQRGLSRGRIHRRSVGQPRLQGDRQGPRPYHAHRGRPPARRPQAAGGPDPQRQGVPVLARPAPQAR